MVDEAIDHRSGDGRVPEHLAPATEGLVGLLAFCRARPRRAALPARPSRRPPGIRETSASPSKGSGARSEHRQDTSWRIDRPGPAAGTADHVGGDASGPFGLSTGGPALNAGINAPALRLKLRFHRIVAPGLGSRFPGKAVAPIQRPATIAMHTVLPRTQGGMQPGQKEGPPPLLDRLDISGRDQPLLRRCRITSLSVGRMEVRALRTARVRSHPGGLLGGSRDLRSRSGRRYRDLRRPEAGAGGYPGRHRERPGRLRGRSSHRRGCWPNAALQGPGGIEWEV